MISCFRAEMYARQKIAEVQEMYADRFRQLYGKYGWDFEWDNTRDALGRCLYREMEIRLSSFLVPYVKDFSEIEDTVLHELAHALAGPKEGHGPVWKEWARKLGANPNACYSSSKILEVGKVPAKYSIICNDGCGVVGIRHRLSKKAKRILDAREWSFTCSKCGGKNTTYVQNY